MDEFAIFFILLLVGVATYLIFDILNQYSERKKAIAQAKARAESAARSAARYKAQQEAEWAKAKAKAEQAAEQARVAKVREAEARARAIAHEKAKERVWALADAKASAAREAANSKAKAIAQEAISKQARAKEDAESDEEWIAWADANAEANAYMLEQAILNAWASADIYTKGVLTGASRSFSWLDSSIEFTNESRKNGYSCYSLLTYYPKRYNNAPKEVVMARQVVFNFKDGKNIHYLAEVVASAIYNKFYYEFRSWNENNTVFAVIPASTKTRTEVRYKEFCSLVAKYLGVKNGYESITVRFDKSETKGLARVDKVSNLGYSAVLIKDKHVLLFDDVKTSGTSFLQNAEMLELNGAHKISGFFLAETYDSFKNGEPHWAQPQVTSSFSNNFSNDEPDDLPF